MFKVQPHRTPLRPHLSRVCTGQLFDTLQTVVDLMRIASPRTGLRTTVNIIRRIYETGQSATPALNAHIRSPMQFADFLPQWNDSFIPGAGQ